MGNGKFKLDGHRPVLCEDVLEWGRWFETADKRVAIDTIGNVQVSTVFLGLDHNFGRGEPLLFETMVFMGPLNEEMDRYPTWEAAEAGHAVMVERVRAAATEPAE
jgi:trimethylamine:corrinoid methyltransferase-like protein